MSLLFQSWCRLTSLIKRDINPVELISRGDHFLCRAQLNDALKCYQKASKLIYFDLNISKKEGMILGMMGRYMEAIATFDRALVIVPCDFEVWMNKGFNFWRLQRWKEALISFEKAISINPHDEYARHCRKLSKEEICRKKHGRERRD